MYNEVSCQLKRVAEFTVWCADHDVNSDHLLDQARMALVIAPI
jgi:hypothetical protein